MYRYRLYNNFAENPFESLQQILFHLSQITPRRQTIRLKEQKSQKKVKSSNSVQNDLAPISCADLNKLCTDSLAEAMRNFKSSPNATILELPLSAVAAQKWSSKQLQRSSSPINSLEAKMKTSYISKASFQQNKAEPIWDPLNAVTVSAPLAGTNNFLQVANIIGELSRPQFIQ